MYITTLYCSSYCPHLYFVVSFYRYLFLRFVVPSVPESVPTARTHSSPASQSSLLSDYETGVLTTLKNLKTDSITSNMGEFNIKLIEKHKLNGNDFVNWKVCMKLSSVSRDYTTWSKEQKLQPFL
ncbi:hypothetical protein O181_013958 [Austropuccinia psidii MF-1]|uniref:Uncharacterized protein n=1 Tax=Austropuccinia psidii MF-1 TaxID=1389203 RepID=A0A9Q3BZP4_9BASI|nr:hypothetical protein [Austropuccinia psidii MF-1]